MPPPTWLAPIRRPVVSIASPFVPEVGERDGDGARRRDAQDASRGRIVAAADLGDVDARRRTRPRPSMFPKLLPLLLNESSGGTPATFVGVMLERVRRRERARGARVARARPAATAAGRAAAARAAAACGAAACSGGAPRRAAATAGARRRAARAGRARTRRRAALAARADRRAAGARRAGTRAAAAPACRRAAAAARRRAAPAATDATS